MSKYSEEFKLKIVKEHKETHIGAESLQRKYGVYHSQIEQWIAQFELTGTFTKPTAPNKITFHLTRFVFFHIL